MIYFILYSLLCYTAAAGRNLKVVKYEDSVDTIVKDLIDNWQSPLVYLKSRGYLPKDLQNSPELDFQQLQGNLIPNFSLKDSKREVESTAEAKANSKSDQRDVRSAQDLKELELKRMFQSLFSSNDISASEEIKSKLGVSWDMNALKSSARLGAKKYFEKLNNKRNQAVSFLPNETPSSPVSGEVFQNFHAPISLNLEKKDNETIEKASYDTKPSYLKGVAKILSNPEIRYKDWEPKPAQESFFKATGKVN
ncbi:uncharacterized protein LOC108101906 [Drosophila ficusphila]|uniref:uncharacterized protein LOC108101906 n=1 Tax=Drosophila ficusphila TaxID=30025 RepID=UPI0007E801B9|nr:uncharacterized protein LOC108101906 [Drosophila ficusphila]